MACLIAFGGLPGVGKSTIARALAAALPAVWLRIDTIEASLYAQRGQDADLRMDGYEIAAGIAADLLPLGHHVIADAVNSVPVTRALWRDTAERVGAPALEVELICSDTAAHRARIEARPGRPDWSDVLARRYDPWPEAALTLDTARMSPEEAVAVIAEAVV